MACAAAPSPPTAIVEATLWPTLAPATAGVDLLFGSLDVQVAETRIVGVDAVLRLGTEYLELISESAGADG